MNNTILEQETLQATYVPLDSFGGSFDSFSDNGFESEYVADNAVTRENWNQNILQHL